SDYSINHHHSRHFAAVADEIADGYLARLQTEADAFVKSLVSATQQNESWILRQFLHNFLREPVATGGQSHKRSRIGVFLLHLLQGREYRLWHQHHARPAAEGPVIHALVLAGGPISDVPQMNRHQAALDGQLQNTLAQVTLEQIRKQGEDIEAHGWLRRSVSPAGRPPWPLPVRTWPNTSSGTPPPAPTVRRPHSTSA